MEKAPDTAPVAAELRRQAEARLVERRKKTPPHSKTKSSARRLIHELEVHQIELEMQNEELTRARGELEASHAKYFDLFDLAPIGYLTIGETGIVMEANLAAATLLGVERSRLINKPATRFIVKEDQDIYHLHRRRLFETRARQACELRMTGKGRGLIWVHLEGSTGKGGDNAPVCRATLSDITELKRAEGRLKSLLKEKELLVKEVHHRVKNNFAIVSSLLSLQSQQIEDESIKNLFMKSRDRIKSMSLVHERLYQSQDLTHINLSDYIRTLADDLLRAYETDRGKPTLAVEADDVAVDVDRVIPCGLVLNELISNALKHGFLPEEAGNSRIEVRLRRIRGNTIELAVKDYGPGLPDDFKIEKTSSLGLKIVSLLVEDQLNGELKIEKNEGTQFRVRFNAGRPSIIGDRRSEAANETVRQPG
jgi:PAS domain S-box-containing protein